MRKGGVSSRRRSATHTEMPTPSAYRSTTARKGSGKKEAASVKNTGSFALHGM